ncbi:MAG: MFS transporter [Bergeyella sp.]|nr:MFS transporter [Bergeyella sp.]
MIKKILPLTLGGLAIGTTEFVIMGLLPDVARSLDVSIPEAGHFISSYALGVVVGAPLLVAFSSKLPPKKILLLLLLVFVVFNGLSAVMPNYITFLFVRFFAGLPHGAFFGVGTAVAKNIAPPKKQGQAIAGMFAGLTIANFAMVPLVTFIGHQFSWRSAFGMVALLGLISMMAVHYMLPNLKSFSQGKVLEDLKFLKKPVALFILSIVAIGFGGMFSWFSYISPLMTEVSKFPETRIPFIMILAGSGMFVGNFLGGWMADKMRPALASNILMIFFIVALMMVFFLSENQTISLVLTFVCGMLSMSVVAPINILIIRAAQKAEMLGAAFMQAAFNIANSIGAYLGGIPLLHGLGYQYTSLVGAVLVFGGFVLSLIFMIKFKPFVKSPEEYSIH